MVARKTKKVKQAQPIKKIFSVGRFSAMFFMAILVAILMVLFYTYQQIKDDIQLKLNHRALWSLMDIVEYGRAQPSDIFLKTISKENIKYINLDDHYLNFDISTFPHYIPLINAHNKTELLHYADQHDFTQDFSLYIKPNLWLNVAVRPNYNYLLVSVSGHIVIMLFLCFTLLFSAFIIYRLLRNIKRAYAVADDIGIKPNKSVVMTMLDGSNDLFFMLEKRINDLINTRTQILSSISHDLKTPLTRINYRLQLLSTEGDLKQKCLQDTKEMQAMINELVSMSRFEEAKKITFDLDALVDTVVEGYIEQGVEITYQSSEAAIIIYGSEDVYIRILYNLIGNALKFATKIKVLLVRKNNNIIALSVTDNGPGVPDDLSLNELFRRRVQADNQEMSRTTDGSGLGLAIVYELVHQTGGTVKLKNLSPTGFGVFIVWGNDL